MNEVTSIGQLVVNLGVFVGLLVGLKTLAKNGNGSAKKSDGSETDVTRREFEELKTLTHMTLKELKEQCNNLRVCLAALQTTLKIPQANT
jgi:hypothetical protein